MREVTTVKKIYEFNELSEDAKSKAIADRIEMWVDTIPIDEVAHNSNYYRAYKKSEEMQTPWFFGNYVYDYCEKEIVKELKREEFEEDGTLWM